MTSQLKSNEEMMQETDSTEATKITKTRNVRCFGDFLQTEKMEGNRPKGGRRRRRRRGRRNGWTKAKKDPTADTDRVVSLDCEMVGVGPGGKRSVLARVSMVDWDGRIVFDSFVKVEEPVTDYRTPVSGIRSSDLEGPDAMEFGKCRSTVLTLLSYRVLVGHGLLNDLTVLDIVHPPVLTRDSAYFAPFLRPNMQSNRLKDLAKSHLGIEIQQEGESHDSIEDAWAAMQLYKLYKKEWDKFVRETFMGVC